ncbi:ATP adenylyltransferase-domain-containing protein [Aspergillus pseudodeflectus]|uniref:ATP adenylyltransferase-domain-containing protein n=1 Tax=Aspergillus pseudodeflectus TaxID=176178 RepID=A0ABR4LC72_9EURO
MQLGITENLPALVAKRFAAAKDAGHLTFSQTHLAILHTGGIPFQLRYCPALANKPTGKPKPDESRTGRRFDPFENPSPELLIAHIPKENPTHFLVLNKFPVIPNHFILATKDWQEQTDILEKEDLAAAYACVKAWKDENQTSSTRPRRLFAFFNSGEESGASQPHRHLQFLPIEAIAEADNSGSWRPLIDAVSSRPDSSDSEFRRITEVPVANFALPLPSDSSAESLHRTYLTLYKAAAVAAGVPRSAAQATSGPAVVSYNLAMTESTMMICPRRSTSAHISVDDATREDVAEAGIVELNGTVLAGTLMVKAEAEWDELRRTPDSLARVLEAIGYPHPDLREVSLL